MTSHLLRITCPTALLLHLTIWRNFPSDQIPIILAHYDDGGEVHMTDAKTIAYKTHVFALKANIPRAGGLPLEIHQSPPDYFLLVDSGANVHVFLGSLAALLCTRSSLQCAMGQHTCFVCLHWCLLFVLIRQGLRGGSGPQRLMRALGLVLTFCINSTRA